ncbi:MAG TPA: FAD-binding oxidoreductase [Woeseiaceae bacterium]|nr:FAD-binding oxidoreductase [Woeseiaceae bacterium]
MLLERLKSIVGPDGWTDDPATLQPHLTEWRDRYVGSTPLMVSPANTEEVSAVVKACAETGTGVVPQGGNTGLCGGAIPQNGEILLSLNRMHAIRSISKDGYSVIAEAGCILADVQAAAAEVDRLFPLSISAEGSCRIGGNLSTNAGGINVLRYGNARSQVLGLEVVLADGRVWNGLRTLRKDTAGYDLKQLFIGAEGTLGIITAAALRLYPRVRDVQTAFVAVSDARQAVQLLSHLRDSMADRLQAFELIQERALAFVLQHIPSTRDPFDERHPWYVLLEISRSANEGEMESVLADALEHSLVVDAVIAKSRGEAEQLWRLRHSISEAQKHEGASLKHDVSVPIDRIGDFIDDAAGAVLQRIPEARIVAFGHVGDGNVHFNVSQPESWTAERFLGERDSVAALVYDLTVSYGGSISAEHGIGLARRDDLRRYRGGTELALMQVLKAALDPANILNPGKVL